MAQMSQIASGESGSSATECLAAARGRKKGEERKRGPNESGGPGWTACSGLQAGLLGLVLGLPDQAVRLGADDALAHRRAGVLGALAGPAQAAVPLPRRGLAAQDAVAGVGLRDPAQVLVRLDGRVVGVEEDDLEVVVLAVLADPVRVEDLEVGEVLGGALLGDGLRVLPHGDLVDTHLGGDAALHEALLAQATAAHAGAHDDDALLGLVAEGAGAVEAQRLVDLDERRAVAPGHEAVPLGGAVGRLVLLPGLSDVVVRVGHGAPWWCEASSAPLKRGVGCG